MVLLTQAGPLTLLDKLISTGRNTDYIFVNAHWLVCRMILLKSIRFGVTDAILAY